MSHLQAGDVVYVNSNHVRPDIRRLARICEDNTIGGTVSHFEQDPKTKLWIYAVIMLDAKRGNTLSAMEVKFRFEYLLREDGSQIDLVDNGWEFIKIRFMRESEEAHEHEHEHKRKSGTALLDIDRLSPKQRQTWLKVSPATRVYFRRVNIDPQLVEVLNPRTRLALLVPVEAVKNVSWF